MSKIHTRKSIRLAGYNYAIEGFYFITICTHNMQSIFGHIEHGIVCLNQFGQIAYDAMLQTPQIRPNVVIDEFIVMPNHLHVIVRIKECVVNQTPNSLCRTMFKSPSQTVGAIVRGYKGFVTKQIKELGFEKRVWHRNYYEEIIKDQQDYYNIVGYIRNNPSSASKPIIAEMISDE